MTQIANSHWGTNQLSLPDPNEKIRCICGYQHDDGSLIQCDKCNEQQHRVCMDINAGNVPEVYESLRVFQEHVTT